MMPALATSTSTARGSFCSTAANARVDLVRHRHVTGHRHELAGAGGTGGRETVVTATRSPRP